MASSSSSTNTAAPSSDSRIPAIGANKSPDELLALYRSESTPPSNATLVWQAPSPGSTQGLSHFLDSHLPSKTNSLPGEKYIWIVLPHKRTAAHQPKSDDEMKAALARIHEEFEELRLKCVEIDDDERIPLRQNRKQGMSKSQRKKLAIEQWTPGLERSADDGGLLTGRWMLFKEPHWADSCFRSLAWSLVDGLLSKCTTANVHTIRVDCADQKRDSKGGKSEHCVSLFFEDSWAEEPAKIVGQILLKEICQFPRAVKTDLYSMMGIDSKHWTGVASSVHRLDYLIPKDTQQELVQDYRDNKAKRDKQKKDREDRGYYDGDSPEKTTAEASGSGSGHGASSSSTRNDAGGQASTSSSTLNTNTKNTTMSAGGQAAPSRPAPKPYIPSANPDDSHTEDEDEEEEMLSGPRRTSTSTAGKDGNPNTSTSTVASTSTSSTAATSAAGGSSTSSAATTVPAKRPIPVMRPPPRPESAAEQYAEKQRMKRHKGF